eukprot:TRINITY_DN8825_c0_g2_i1.p1 TRINITY_DN8825_c0_g2~~TRINITY_DN8825_c0_g2_i1.p1  ORF type:complete len:368 (+),score=59.78 TRINITY_DN8825_c0_g2_i1:40-1143(+)
MAQVDVPDTHQRGDPVLLGELCILLKAKPKLDGDVKDLDSAKALYKAALLELVDTTQETAEKLVESSLIASFVNEEYSQLAQCKQRQQQAPSCPPTKQAKRFITMQELENACPEPFRYLLHLAAALPESEQRQDRLEAAKAVFARFRALSNVYAPDQALQIWKAKCSHAELNAQTHRQRVVTVVKDDKQRGLQPQQQQQQQQLATSAASLSQAGGLQSQQQVTTSPALSSRAIGVQTQSRCAQAAMGRPHASQCQSAATATSTGPLPTPHLQHMPLRQAASTLAPRNYVYQPPSRMLYMPRKKRVIVKRRCTVCKEYITNGNHPVLGWCFKDFPPVRTKKSKSDKPLARKAVEKHYGTQRAAEWTNG